METSPKPSGGFSPCALFCQLLGMAAALAPAGFGVETTEPKLYVLFMGADIDVQVNDEIHRVKNVAGDAFVVAIKGEPVEVRAKRGPVRMKVTPQMKLTNKTATVKDLKFTRAYTPGHDPHVKWSRFQSGGAAQSYVGSSAGLMASAMMGAQQNAVRMSNLGGGGGGGSGLGPPDPVVMQFVANFNQANYDLGVDMNSAGYAAGQMEAELSQQLFDAIEVSFEINAPALMWDPYLLIVAQYRDPDAPKELKSWIYARALDRVDPRPNKVKFLQGGFPPGFELVSQEVHFYGAGRELATDVSDQRVSLSRSEAHQYIVVNHRNQHKGATVAPAIALGVGRRSLYPHYGSEQVEQIIYVKVDKNGVPQGAFRDEGCSEPSEDDYLSGLVAQTCFTPALQEGTAVDGVARLKIVELAR
jgi:hypothetical protein